MESLLQSGQGLLNDYTLSHLFSCNQHCLLQNLEQVEEPGSGWTDCGLAWGVTSDWVAGRCGGRSRDWARASARVYLHGRSLGIARICSFTLRVVLCWEDLVSESTLELFLIAQLDDLCIGIWMSVFIIFPNERKQSTAMCYARIEAKIPPAHTGGKRSLWIRPMTLGQHSSETLEDKKLCGFGCSLWNYSVLQQLAIIFGLLLKHARDVKEHGISLIRFHGTSMAM